MTRKLTKQTVRPVLRFVYCEWGNSIYSLNTTGSKYYGFTLDKYKGKNSWQGAFLDDLSDALEYQQYALCIKTGDIYDKNHNIIMRTEHNTGDVTA